MRFLHRPCLSKFVIIWFTIIITLLTGPLPVCSLVNDLTVGIGAVRAGDYPQAIKSLQNVVENDKSSGADLVQAYTYLTYAYYYNQEPLLAGDAAHNLFLLDPGFATDLDDPGLRLFLAQVKQQMVNTLRISSEPEGAKVYMDDVLKGATPLIIENVDPGLHFFTFKYRQHKDLEKTLYIEPATVNRLDVRLEPTGRRNWLWYLVGSAVLGSAVMAGLSFIDTSDDGTPNPAPLDEPPPPPE